MDEFTFVTTYYSQEKMLTRQLQEWAQYPPTVSVILVDDGSPMPALPVITRHMPLALVGQVRVYRILEDIPWARSTCRNLAMQEAKTPWCVVTDIDHVLGTASTQRLLDFTPQSGQWYRFPRYRRGRADATRNKDAIPREAPYGRIHPHGDSFLIERGLYWDAGGLDEIVFNGALGGGSEFLHRLERLAPAALLPEDIFLEVYTRDVIPDASVTGLSRDTAEYTRRRRQKEASGRTKPERVVILPWEQVL